MVFELQPLKITKELILSKVSEEQMMEHYLGIPCKKGLFKNPLRKDNNPTASFYRNNKGQLLFKDFRGDFCGDVFAVVMEKFNCSFYTALQIIANDFNIINRKDFKKNKPKLEYTDSKFEESKSATIQVEIRPFQEYELAWWKRFGITKETLEKFKVYSCKNIWLNGNLFHTETQHQLIFGYYGGIKDGIELWRCYHPSKKKYKFISNWKSNQIQGGKMLPKDGGENLVITKSLKDCMLLYELGIPAIAPCSENLFVSQKQFEKLKSKFKNIFLFYDNDQAGVSNMNKIRKQFPELIVTFIPRNLEAKDISDFYFKYGKKRTIELINKAKEHYLNGKKN